jgi:steroid delta-isomerase-like uncharacterized protein
MSEQNKAIVTRFFAEVCNGRKLNVADEIFAANHVHHDPANPQIGTGPAGIKQLVSIYQTAFPDAHWTVEEMIAEGDTVVTRWTGRGTHKADLQGLAPTGQSVTVPGIWIHKFANGKVVESWDAWDTYGMLRAIGAIGAPGSAAAAQ